MKIAAPRDNQADPVMASSENFDFFSYSGQGRDDCVVHINTNLADLFTLQKRYKEAEEHLKTALKVAEEQFGKTDPITVGPLIGMVRLYTGANQSKDFFQAVDRIYEVAAKQPGLAFDVKHPLWSHFFVALDIANPAFLAKSANRLMTVYAVQKYDTGDFAVRTQDVARNDWAKIARAQEVFRQAAVSKFVAEPAKAGQILMDFAASAERGEQRQLARTNCQAVVTSQQSAADKTFPSKRSRN